MDFKDTLILVDNIIKKCTKTIMGNIPNIVISLIIIIIAYFVGKIFKKIYKKSINKLFPNLSDIAKIIEATINTVYWTVVILLVLDVLNLSSFVTHLLAGAGIVGIIAGFALKDVASNTFAGLIVRVRHPFEINDWITINEITGQIKSISLIGTVVKTFEGQMAYIPNQLLLNNSFLNHSTYEEVKIIIDVGVSYGDDLAHVQKVALEAINSLPMIKKDKPVDFYYTNIGSSTYNFEVRYWVKFKDRVDFLYARSEGIKSLKTAFEKENICVAYNVTTLDFGVKGGVNLYDNPITVKENSNKISFINDNKY